MRYAVIDPVLRLPVTSAARDRAQWVPIRPGMDSALALGMIRYILDNNRHDAAFLCHPTLAAARKAGEAGIFPMPRIWCGFPAAGRALLRAADLGAADLAGPTRTTPWS